MPARGTPSFARRERPRVLVVEDHAAIRETLSALLDRSGYDVVAARSLGEAHECLATRYGAYDAVILDLMLPDGSGVEIIPAIRGLGYMSGTRIVVCSAADRGGSLVRRAIEAGADAVHFKPVSFGDELDYRARVTRGGLLSVIRGENPGDVQMPAMSPG